MLGESEQTSAPTSGPPPVNQFSLRALLWGIALVGVILIPIANFGVDAVEVLPFWAIGIVVLVLVARANTSTTNKVLIVIGLEWFVIMAAARFWGSGVNDGIVAALRTLSRDPHAPATPTKTGAA